MQGRDLIWATCSSCKGDDKQPQSSLDSKTETAKAPMLAVFLVTTTIVVHWQQHLPLGKHIPSMTTLQVLVFLAANNGNKFNIPKP